MACFRATPLAVYRLLQCWVSWDRRHLAGTALEAVRAGKMPAVPGANLSYAVRPIKPLIISLLLFSSCLHTLTAAAAPVSDGIETTGPQLSTLAAIADPAHQKMLEDALAKAKETDKEKIQRSYFHYASLMADSGGNWETANGILLKLLEDKSLSTPLRVQVIEKLVQRGDAGSLPALLSNLKHSSPDVTSSVLNAFASMNGRDVTRALVAVFRDASDADQLQLAKPLAARNDPMVLAAFGKAFPSSKNSVQLAMIQALAAGKDALTVELLERFAAQSQGPVALAAKDAADQVRKSFAGPPASDEKKQLLNVVDNTSEPLAGQPDSAQKPKLRFRRTKLSDERFEASAVCDLNNDQTTDIVSGGFWYPGPDFKTPRKICDVQASGEYFDDFSDFPMDINGDGFADLITGGFFGGPLRWRENPKGAFTTWSEHAIGHVGSIETTRFWDVDGDGHEEICPNASGNIMYFKLVRDAKGSPQTTFTKHAPKMGGNGHGLGFGDINGDGRPDFIGPDGWYEAPASNADSSEWAYHREFRFGAASVPILVYDVNRDGKNDIIVGQGHDYGLQWYEQTADQGKRSWKRHDIDRDMSQFHEMALADIDNDGELELVTGKRYRAHNDNDPGSRDPLGISYYEINGGKFDRIRIDYGPGSESAGTGIYLWIADIDGNGWKDIVCPGKQGLYLLSNQGY